MNEYEIEDIYYTLTGQLIPEAEVPGVEDAFAQGSFCAQLLEEIYDARNRVLDRLGVVGEDADLECILSGYETMQEYLCLEMLRLGRRWPISKG